MFDPERAGARGGLYGNPLPGGTAVSTPPTSPGPAVPVPKPLGGGRTQRRRTNSTGARAGAQNLGGVVERNGVPGVMGRAGQFQPLGAAAAARWRAGGGASPSPAPPTATPPSSAPPAPGAPVGGSGGGSAGGPSVPGMSGSSPFVPAPGAPNTPGSFYNEFTDPFAMFFSAIPAMRMNTTRQIGDAVAQAGFTGNRWGTSTQNTVGQIGAEAAARENAMLQGMMADFANNQENRALGASGYAIGAGNAMEEAARNRVTVPFSVGAYEQGRQDDIQRLLFQDWAQNRLGWLGPALDFAGRQGAGSPGSPGQIIQVPGEPAKPGAIDWARVLAEFFG